MDTIRNFHSSKVNVQIRMKVVSNLTSVYQKTLGKSEEEAKKLAQDHEDRIHTTSSTQTYVNTAAIELGRLKKKRAGEDDDDGNNQQCKKKSSSITSTEKELYQKLVSYILTEDQLKTLNYPRCIIEEKETPVEDDNTQCSDDRENNKEEDLVDRKECMRCGKMFEVKSYQDQSEEERNACRYHVDKIRSKNQMGRVRNYLCCDQQAGSSGCVEGPHVFYHEKFEDLYRQFEFVDTANVNNDNDNHGEGCVVLGLDCEMAYTTAGYELLKISIVDHECKVICDHLVETTGDIIDFNTRWSGVDAKSYYSNNDKKTLTEIHEILFKLMSSDGKYPVSSAILVAHSGDSDLRVLRLIHRKVIDTSVIFEHPKGLPWKYSLKHLMQKHLHKFIQDSVVSDTNKKGHDSNEDAISAMELACYYARRDGKIY